jgi:hypothetical protein
MAGHVTVSFELHTVPGLNRHRVSVWSAEGAQLSPPSAQSPDDLVVDEGTLIFVEASVPVAAVKKRAPTRDEKRWKLRASAGSTAVLKLGNAPTYGLSSALEIQIEGAEQNGAPQSIT